MERQGAAKVGIPRVVVDTGLHPSPDIHFCVSGFLKPIKHQAIMKLNTAIRKLKVLHSQSLSQHGVKLPRGMLLELLACLYINRRRGMSQDDIEHWFATNAPQCTVPAAHTRGNGARHLARAGWDVRSANPMFNSGVTNTNLQRGQLQLNSLNPNPLFLKGQTKYEPAPNVDLDKDNFVERMKRGKAAAQRKKGAATAPKGGFDFDVSIIFPPLSNGVTTPFSVVLTQDQLRDLARFVLTNEEEL